MVCTAGGAGAGAGAGAAFGAAWGGRPRGRRRRDPYGRGLDGSGGRRAGLHLGREPGDLGLARGDRDAQRLHRRIRAGGRDRVRGSAGRPRLAGCGAGAAAAEGSCWTAHVVEAARSAAAPGISQPAGAQLARRAGMGCMGRQSSSRSSLSSSSSSRRPRPSLASGPRTGPRQVGSPSGDRGRRLGRAGGCGHRRRGRRRRRRRSRRSRGGGGRRAGAGAARAACRAAAWASRAASCSRSSAASADSTGAASDGGRGRGRRGCADRRLGGVDAGDRGARRRQQGRSRRRGRRRQRVARVVPLEGEVSSMPQILGLPPGRSLAA